MDFIKFLIAAQQVLNHVKTVRTHPVEEQAPAHGACTQLLKRLPPGRAMLWREVELLAA